MDVKLIDEVLLSIKKELESANKKHGSKFNSPVEGCMILKEELDEMWDDIKSNFTTRAILECRQVAAVAIKNLLNFSDKATIINVLFGIKDDLSREFYLKKFNSTHEGYGYILESYEQFWNKVKMGNINYNCDSCIPIAALSVKFIVDFY